ncbi:hypothetical protein [Pseudonocardia sp. MH-G8]|uniref:hypothetical protein n=1 Tax=Pseudonocardia sp. MH-G8 TaxID=1854588 RepID=UPI000BC6759B|nr:hypothetical protein [Pseudonocardia sp. MH-G8]OZM75807.1 hypothetical protein CFP66_44490 [Pseudonocardia sp. MH-G8]
MTTIAPPPFDPESAGALAATGQASVATGITLETLAEERAALLETVPSVAEPAAGSASSTEPFQPGIEPGGAGPSISFRRAGMGPRCGAAAHRMLRPHSRLAAKNPSTPADAGASRHGHLHSE